MEPILVFALYAVALGVGLVEHQRGWIRARGNAWIEAFERHEFRASTRYRRFDWTIHARSEEFIASAVRGAANDRGALTELVLKPRRWHGGDVAIWSSVGAPGGAAPATRVRTGDAAFDASVFLSGPPDRLLAVFDRPTRETLLKLSTWSEVTVSAGAIRLRLDESRLNVAQAKVLGETMNVARRLASELDVPAELDRNGREDPLAGVRECNLLALSRGYADDPRTGAALVAACADRSLRVRFVAARELREAGAATLLELLDDPAVDDELSAEVVVALGRRFPFARIEAILKQALRARRLREVAALVELCGRHRIAAAAALLMRIVEVEGAELAATAARALGALGTRESEAPLIAALGRDDGAVVLAAVEALGRLGSVTAVMPLRRLAGDPRAEPALRRAVGQALAAIRARTPGASPGQLSLAAGSAGQLSLVPDAAGRLALAGGEAGRLSGPNPRD